MNRKVIENIAKSLADPTEEMELLVLAILDGKTNSGLVPESHIKRIALEFGVQIGEENAENSNGNS